MKFTSNLLSLTLMFLADAVAKPIDMMTPTTSVAMSAFVKGRMRVAPLVCDDACGIAAMYVALQSV